MLIFCRSYEDHIFSDNFNARVIIICVFPIQSAKENSNQDRLKKPIRLRECKVKFVSGTKYEPEPEFCCSVCLLLELSEGFSAYPKSDCGINPSFTAVVSERPGVCSVLLCFTSSNVILENKICDSLVCLPKQKGQRKASSFQLQIPVAVQGIFAPYGAWNALFTWKNHPQTSRQSAKQMRNNLAKWSLYFCLSPGYISSTCQRK